MEQLRRDPSDLERLDREVGALVAEFPSFPRELIERTVAEGLERLGSARLGDFVPLLVHRFSRERLREMSAWSAAAAQEGSQGSG